MAEYMLKARLEPGSTWEVGSAGVSAVSGMTASAEAVMAAADMGIDLKPHRSRPVHPKLIDSADLIVVMTASHRIQMEILFPRAADRTYLLKTFDSEAKTDDIEDPIGMPVDTYRKMRDEIDSALPGLVEFMKAFGE
jgi:protein-tyrosine-phosphatase